MWFSIRPQTRRRITLIERRSHLEDICLAGVSCLCALLTVDSLESAWTTTAVDWMCSTRNIYWLVKGLNVVMWVTILDQDHSEDCLIRRELDQCILSLVLVYYSSVYKLLLLICCFLSFLLLLAGNTFLLLFACNTSTSCQSGTKHNKHIQTRYKRLVILTIWNIS